MIKRWIAASLAASIPYIIASFALLDYDFTNWNEMTRFFVISFAFMLAIMAG